MYMSRYANFLSEYIPAIWIPYMGVPYIVNLGRPYNKDKVNP